MQAASGVEVRGGSEEELTPFPAARDLLPPPLEAVSQMGGFFLSPVPHQVEAQRN